MMNMTEGNKPEIVIQSASLPWTSGTLLVAVVLLVLIFKLHDWTLNLRVGLWLSLVYVVFVLTAIYLEGNYSKTGVDFLGQSKH